MPWARLCRERGAVAAARLPLLDASGFASYGFHGSALGYRAWAAHVAGPVPSASGEAATELRESSFPGGGADVATRPSGAIVRD